MIIKNIIIKIKNIIKNIIIKILIILKIYGFWIYYLKFIIFCNIYIMINNKYLIKIWFKKKNTI